MPVSSTVDATAANEATTTVEAERQTKDGDYDTIQNWTDRPNDLEI